MEENQDSESEKKQSFKEISLIYLGLLRKNLPLLLLLPTLFGGIWQVLSLANVGIPYIRFFSINQLISDGLILIGSILAISLFSLMSYFLAKKQVEILKDKKMEVLIEIVYPMILHLFSLVFLSVVVWKGLTFLLTRAEIDLSWRFLLFSTAFAVPANIIFMETLKRIGDFLEFQYNKRKDFIRSKMLKYLVKAGKSIQSGYFRACIVVHLFAYFFWFILAFKLLFLVGDFYMADNLLNTNRIEKALKEDYNLEPNDFQISYTNDKYIFIKVPDKLSQEEKDELSKNGKIVPFKVIILKLDVLFSEVEPSNGTKR